MSIMDIPETGASRRARLVEALVPTTPAVFHILLALVGGATHGYGIMQLVEQLTGGRVKLGNATLYRSLQMMAINGLVEELSDPRRQTDERRREYRLTHLGLLVARAEAGRMAELVRVARGLSLLLSEKGPGRRVRAKEKAR